MMRDLKTIKKGKNDMDKLIVKIEKSGNRYNAFDKDGVKHTSDITQQALVRKPL